MSWEDGDVEDTMECPICLDELDITDRSFKPCKCGYQMCRFCWNTINENLNGKCPACRQPYNEENFQFIPPNPQEYAVSFSLNEIITHWLVKHNKPKNIKEKEKEKKSTEVMPAKRSLNNVRVIQRNLVYVTNISLNIAKEDVLRRNDYFGRFGKINKIVVNKTNVYNGPQGPSVSAYVTYFRDQDSTMAIKSMDGVMVDGRLMRCSFGTTKYCSYFLRGIRCPNPDCMYLHELGEEVDSFTKEDMAQGKHLLSGGEEDEQRARSILRTSLPSVPYPEQFSKDQYSKAVGGNMGSNPLAQSQPMGIPKGVPSQMQSKTAAPFQSSRPVAQPLPVWKNTDPPVTKEVPISTSNSNLNPEDWPDALSSTPNGKKSKVSSSSSKSPPKESEQHGSGWKTRSATFNAFDDDFDDYSPPSSEEDTPAISMQSSTVGSSSGSGNPSHLPFATTTSGSSSEVKEDKTKNSFKKQIQPPPQKRQQEWRAIQSKPKLEGSSSPETVLVDKNEEQKDNEAKDRENAKQRELYERDQYEKARRDADQLFREGKDAKQLVEFANLLRDTEAPKTIETRKVDLFAAPSVPPNLSLPIKPNLAYSADPTKDNGGFDEWLKAKFADLLMSDVNSLSPSANPSAWNSSSLPMPMPASLAVNAPARSRFQFVQDDDQDSSSPTTASSPLPVPSVEPSEQAQSTLRALFPNVNINFASSSGVQNPALRTSPSTSFPGTVSQPLPRTSVSVPAAPSTGPGNAQQLPPAHQGAPFGQQQPLSRQIGVTNQWPGEGTGYTNGTNTWNSSGQQQQQQPQQQQQWSMNYSQQNFGFNNPGSDMWNTGYPMRSLNNQQGAGSGIGIGIHNGSQQPQAPTQVNLAMMRPTQQQPQLPSQQWNMQANNNMFAQWNNPNNNYRAVAVAPPPGL